MRRRTVLGWSLALSLALVAGVWQWPRESDAPLALPGLQEPDAPGPVAEPATAARDELVVQVVDPARHPLAGARVEILPWFPDPEEPLPEPVLLVRAGPDGCARLSGQTPAHKRAVRVSCPDHLPALATAQVGRAASVALTPAATLRLALLAPQGGAWPTAAQVWLESEPDVFPAGARATLAAGATLDFGPVPFGTAPRLWIATPGRAPEVFATGAQAGGNASRALRMGEAVLLHFQVVDAHDGQAITGAVLSSGPGIELACTSSLGTCTLRAGLGITHRLRCAAMGHAAIEFARRVSGADQDPWFVLRLRRAARVVGLVRDGMDQPVPDVRITVERLGVQELARTRRQEQAQAALPPLAPDTRIPGPSHEPIACTDANGRFVLDGLASADGVLSVVLHAQRAGFARAASPELLLDAGTRQETTTILLRRAASIVGTVRTGTVPVRASVSAGNGPTGDLVQALDDGSYSLTGLWPGVATLTAVNDEQAQLRATLSVSLAEGATLTRDITLSRSTGVIPVRVLTSEGAPMPGLVIMALPEDGTRDRQIHRATTGPDGQSRLLVSNEGSARYSVGVRAGCLERTRSHVAGDGALVDLRFPHLVPLRLTVVDDATGERIPRATVRVESHALEPTDRAALRREEHHLERTVALQAPLGEATLHVAARHAGYPTRRVDVFVARDGPPLEVRLVRGAVVRLRLPPGTQLDRSWGLELTPAGQPRPRSREDEPYWFTWDQQGGHVTGVPPGVWTLSSPMPVVFTPATITIDGPGEVAVDVTCTPRR